MNRIVNAGAKVHHLAGAKLHQLSTGVRVPAGFGQEEREGDFPPRQSVELRDEQP